MFGPTVKPRFEGKVHGVVVQARKNTSTAVESIISFVSFITSILKPPKAALKILFSVFLLRKS